MSNLCKFGKKTCIANAKILKVCIASAKIKKKLHSQWRKKNEKKTCIANTKNKKTWIANAKNEKKIAFPEQNNKNNLHCQFKK